MAAQESRRDDRHGHDRRWPAGAGPEYELVLTGRVIATLVILQFQLPQAALVLFYGVDRSVITRAVHEVRRPRAACGFAVPHRHGLLLHTLADVFARAASEVMELRIDPAGCAAGVLVTGVVRYRAFVA